jgi:4'-phosphopantetheinyl transferase
MNHCLANYGVDGKAISGPGFGPSRPDIASGAWFDAPESLSLPADAVHVWRVGIKALAQHLPHLERLLSAEERMHVARYRREEDRACRIVARGALRSLLSKYLGRSAEELTFIHGPHGKPMLDPASSETTIEFNLSHSGDVVLLAFSGRGAVGIDVEVVRADIDLHGLAARVLGPEEIAIIERADETLRAQLFFQAWTRKEAVLKALGTGFSVEPRELVVLTEPVSSDGPTICRGPAGTLRPLGIVDIVAGQGFAAAVAGESLSSRTTRTLALAF